MIDNEFVCELDLNLDIRELLSIMSNLKSNELKPHQQHCTDYEYINNIYQRHIDILGALWNHYLLAPNTGIPMHTDAGRPSALNIPLYGSSSSTTTFYEMPVKESLYDDRIVSYRYKDKTRELFKFTLNRPTLVRTNVPHSVMAGNEKRLIISWGLLVDFDYAKEYFKKNSLI
jgi:hypothetical protein